MPDFRLTPRAQEDLREIWRTIAADNEPAADRLLNRFFDRFELAARYPDMGPARPEIGAGVRLLIEGRYIALYEPAAFGVLVVAVVSSERDPAHWLG